MCNKQLNNKNNNHQETIEHQLDVISQLNVFHLQLFEADLQGLAQKTIKAHLKNIDFFLNTYLLFDEPAL